MRVQDFGRFDGPVTLVGGPYSNLQATEALIAQATGPVICTGDIVAYCADPAATVAAVRAAGWMCVAGNCERQLAEDAPDCGCGFDNGTACDRLSAEWYPFARQHTRAEDRTWMADLPEIGVFEQAGHRYAVLHGGATAINRFLWPSSPQDDLVRECAAVEAHTGTVDGIVAGHSGIAFNRTIDRWHWINAGALGLPPHDGRPQTRYARLIDGQVTIHRLTYDHAAARAAMVTAGLTQGYHDSLTSGIWPSEDILPTDLRR